MASRIGWNSTPLASRAQPNLGSFSSQPWTHHAVHRDGANQLLNKQLAGNVANAAGGDFTLQPPAARTLASAARATPMFWETMTETPRSRRPHSSSATGGIQPTKAILGCWASLICPNTRPSGMKKLPRRSIRRSFSLFATGIFTARPTVAPVYGRTRR
jgi:hypothetical protein